MRSVVDDEDVVTGPLIRRREEIGIITSFGTACDYYRSAVETQIEIFSRELTHTKEVIKMYNTKARYGQLGVYAIVLKENLKMIGTVELHTYTPHFKAELGYTINPKYWGNGYATEAAKKIIEWGFITLGLKRIECSSFPENERSQAVCKRLGFTFECIRKKGYYSYDGTIHDLVCYSMTDDDYLKIWVEKQ